MTEILSRLRFQHEADNTLKQIRENLRHIMSRFYESEIKMFRKKDKRGIIIDYGSPTKPAILLPSDGNLRLIQYGWTPEPEKNGELSDSDFCILAIELLKNPPKYPQALLKSRFIKSHAWPT
ncbi:MAG: hypothetical protein HYT08_04480 [Candidatus Levybacteria bacterium]|nr:hypothetical protein [Candidatus Levybacteria bacterium]